MIDEMMDEKESCKERGERRKEKRERKEKESCTHPVHIDNKIVKKKCKKLVKKLYGEEKWDEEKFNKLLSTGCAGDVLLEQMGISKEHFRTKYK